MYNSIFLDEQLPKRLTELFEKIGTIYDIIFRCVSYCDLPI